MGEHPARDKIESPAFPSLLFNWIQRKSLLAIYCRKIDPVVLRDDDNLLGVDLSEQDPALGINRTFQRLSRDSILCLCINMSIWRYSGLETVLWHSSTSLTLALGADEANSS
ncbi:hypothetical protein KQX54_009785 [Cotesia glomerata]|uniref:Uncharacterized protein n=1 Tax=Cotesia glomerata TaxID=32391 RepID=A0AAV7I9S7_COTGL|nr:hypothetical protein KQX54_009785 [Cotesia glomerata]